MVNGHGRLGLYRWKQISTLPKFLHCPNSCKVDASARMIQTRRISRHGNLLLLWFAWLYIAVCRGSSYSRNCISSAFKVDEGLCNGTKFNIKSCQYAGKESSKLMILRENVIKISKFKKTNCPEAQPVDAVCKSYFENARVGNTFRFRLFQILMIFSYFLIIF